MKKTKPGYVTLSDEYYNDDTVCDPQKERCEDLLDMFENEVQRQEFNLTHPYELGITKRPEHKLSMMRDEILRRMLFNHED